MKREKGLTGVDISIAVIAIMLFTGIILSLMYNVRLENIKIKAKTMANIYLTETMENIGIVSYEEVAESNQELLPEINNFFKETIEVTKISKEDLAEQDIVKKVKVKVSYTIGNKTYEETMQRLKVKE